MIRFSRAARFTVIALTLVSVSVIGLLPPQLGGVIAAERTVSAPVTKCCCGSATGTCCGTACCSASPQQHEPPFKAPTLKVRRVELGSPALPGHRLEDSPFAGRTAAPFCDRALAILPTLQSEWVRIQV